MAGKAHVSKRKFANGNPMPVHRSPGKLEFRDRILYVFTDGSSVRSGAGGWGVILRWNGQEREMYGGQACQTNNTQELTAILRGLSARTRDVPTIVFSDSQYAINAVSIWTPGWERNGWLTYGGKPVKNKELILAIRALITPDTRFQWVKGHIGHEYNERADDLARKGRLEFGHLAEGGQIVGA